MMGVTLFGLQPSELTALWDEFWSLLKKANDFDPACVIDEPAIRAAIENGNAVGLYRISNGVMRMALTLEIKQTLRGKVCEIAAIGGHGLDDWLNGLDGIERWAKSNDCKFLTASGRAGWERVLKDRGFRRVAVTVEKAL